MMNRSPLECQSKWSQAHAKKLKKGPFTAEEDAIINQRVAEWGDKGEGLWVGLGKYLERPASAISNRWSDKLDPALEEFQRGPWSHEEVMLTKYIWIIQYV